jgi:hypothetical protein
MSEDRGDRWSPAEIDQRPSLTRIGRGAGAWFAEGKTCEPIPVEKTTRDHPSGFFCQGSAPFS